VFVLGTIIAGSEAGFELPPVSLCFTFLSWVESSREAEGGWCVR